MTATNLNFLINVDISGVPQGGDIKNLTTVLVVFDGIFAGVDVFEDVAGIDGSGYTADQKDVLKHGLQQSGVNRILAAEVETATTMQDILDDNDGFFAVVFGDDDSMAAQAFDDFKGSDYLMAYAIEDDGSAPPTPDDTYDNIFVFADDGVDDDGAAEALKPYKLAVGSMAKTLGFDPDLRAAQADWQTIVGQGVSHYDATERTTLTDLNYNVYGKYQGVSIVSAGVNTQGIPINVVVARYWLEARLREAVGAHQHRIANQFGMNPYDSGGIAGVVSVCYDVLNRGETIGHFIEDYSQVNTPILSQVSEQDLRDGLLRVDVMAVQRWRIHQYQITGAIVPTVNEVQ